MGGVIGVGNDIWIGERERITYGIWFWSCWSITLPILLWADYYFAGVLYDFIGDRKFLTVITKIKRKIRQMEIFHPSLPPILTFKSTTLNSNSKKKNLNKSSPIKNLIN